MQIVVIIALGLLVVTAARIEGTIGRAVHAEREADVSTLTFTKTLEDGTVITLTVTQQQGESTEAFHARARREWAAFCEQHGG